VIKLCLIDMTDRYWQVISTAHLKSPVTMPEILYIAFSEFQLSDHAHILE